MENRNDPCRNPEAVLSKREIELLFLFEQCVTYFLAAVPREILSNEDMEIAKSWNRTGFIELGVINNVGYTSSLFVKPSQAAWALLSRIKKERADKAIAAMNYIIKPIEE